MTPSQTRRCYKEEEDTCHPGIKAQAYPKSGQLAKNMNLPLKELQKRLAGESKAVKFYVYILSTLDFANGLIQQKGSGPNFQGEIISLCTCKHWMRTWLNVVGPNPLWVAGLTGIKVVGDDRLHIFYLMYVDQKHPNHRNAWYAQIPKVREAKNASKRVLGDLYEPHEELKSNDWYNPENYHPPIKDHPHLSQDKDGTPFWHYDIHPQYCDNGGNLKPYTLLFGDSARSFLWSTPTIQWEDDPGFTQGQRVHTQDEFLYEFAK